MLLDINGNVLSSPIDQSPMIDNWEEYIIYTKNTHLCNFIKQELLKRISSKKREGVLVIDSTVLIGHFLRELSVNDNFYQQFRVAFSKLDSSLVLGMQLYMLLLEDDKKWTFLKSEKDDAVFTSASYVFLSG